MAVAVRVSYYYAACLLSTLIAATLHFDQTAIERRAAADVCKALGRESVGVAAVGGALVPAHRGRAGDSGLHRAVHLSAKSETAAIVEGPHQIARADGACSGIHGVQVKHGGLRIGARAVSERRIHAVVVFGGNQLQRITAAQRLIAETRFERRCVIQTLRSQLATARGRTEASLGE